MKISKKTIMIGMAIVLLLAVAMTALLLLRQEEPRYSGSVESVPAFSGEAYVVIDDNRPEFDELDTESFEFYSKLDDLGRCGYAMACIGPELMPTEDRESISHIKPSGWQSVQYDFVDGKYLYNRCHLIGFQLTGENANAENLITGTRFLNVEGMLPFENMVADYIKETGNHVLYRVTPIFQGNELVARGVEIEAFSVEDDGEGICFHIYAYNNQPGVEIDYATGESRKAPLAVSGDDKEADYVLNTNSRKFHNAGCDQVARIKESNKQLITTSRANMIAQGYEPSGCCNP